MTFLQFILKNLAVIGSQTVSLKVVITPPRVKPTWLNYTLRQWALGNTCYCGALWD